MAGLWLPIWHTYLAHLAPITVSPILHPLSMASPLTSCYRNSLLICCFKFSVMNSLVICGAPTLTLFCMCQSDALFVQSAIISFFLYSCGQVLTLLEFFFYVKKYRFLLHNLIVSMCRHDCRLEIDHEKVWVFFLYDPGHLIAWCRQMGGMYFNHSENKVQNVNLQQVCGRQDCIYT